ncbi:MAG: cyclic nucleotide-binding protein [Henriciella sp.]|jgi:NTE family protein|uniref:patatin-like phospholipase family protein n=1 Tax=Henriciella sp. TaxID=1968823 RepID=UPI000C11F776|nr:patatin-like phospholipase family protein [Henriciella sp.]MAN72751.1 cyclic nucleotide-binding protein [Henriciella sp.]MBF35010.1 cyclic nucleotide-binding protein [Hyphomonadaceae bacterium]PHR81585.1 MAG: cyclic nucleotide-binding protein [Henriciella sp.]|tara:strand:- start:478 stop:2298 length:1821 start_codon:yes stop_codon:yes gene_type:complete
MSLDISPTLKSIPILGDVPKRALKAAGREAKWFALPAGWELFKAGEISDSIYFVLSGSLGAFQAMPDGRSDFLGHIRAGEPVGEMALFEGAVDEDGDGLPDNAPHTSSVYALRDSEVLEISRKGFDRITKADPDILSSMIRVMLMRLREGRKPNRRNAPKVFALVATSPTIDLELRAEALQKALQRFNMNCRIIDEAEGRDKPTGYFDELEANYDIVMLVTSVGDSSWFRLSTRQADRVWVFGRADARPSNPLLPSHDSPASTLQLVDMILLHHSSQRPASQPADWLDASGAARLFHWHGLNTPSCERLARVMAGRSTGVILSGGGARAYAHIGVVRALREAEIPIDFAGGASMGAVVAACVAMGWPDDEIERRIRKAFVESNPLGDYNLPVISLIRGKRVNRRLEEHFGDVDIDDLHIPFFAVSTNLTDGTYRVHRRGQLRTALRATISLPGILPPVVHNGEVLVDGAVLNNFPTDVMRELHRGVVIGSDVARAPEGLKAEDFVNPPGFFEWVWKHGFSSAPPIAGLLMRSATLKVNPSAGRALVDMLILPELRDIELRDWTAFEEAVEAGYTAAQKAIAKGSLTEFCYGPGSAARPKGVDLHEV